MLKKMLGSKNLKGLHSERRNVTRAGPACDYLVRFAPTDLEKKSYQAKFQPHDQRQHHGPHRHETCTDVRPTHKYRGWPYLVKKRKVRNEFPHFE